MIIRLLHFDDLPIIFKIYKNCTKNLQLQGLERWNRTYPDLNQIQEDLDNNSLYGVFLNDILYGCYVLDEEQSPEYLNIEWEYNEGPIAVLHRMAVCPNSQGIGIGEKLLNHAIENARQSGYKSIRLDAFTANDRLLQFYTKRNFKQVGEIPLEYTAGPFTCFEMSLISDSA